MLVKNCKGILKVGDRVITNGDNIIASSYTLIKGYIGELDSSGFYIWQNENPGRVGLLSPKGKGYKYSWIVKWSNLDAIININTKKITITEDVILDFFSICLRYEVSDVAYYFNIFYQTDIFTNALKFVSIRKRIKKTKKTIKKITEMYIKKNKLKLLLLTDIGLKK